MSVYDQLDRADRALRRSLVTPEGVDLNLRIGDSGQRIGAFLIDVIIQYGVLFLFALVLGTIYSAVEGKGAENVGVLYFLGAFVLQNGWFIGFELSPRAATPGKRFLGLRVASRDGGRLTAEAVIVRNVTRQVEFFLPVAFIFVAGALGGVDGLFYLMVAIWMGIFLFFPLFNKDRLRVGDLLAGTWVVRSPKRILMPDLSQTGAHTHAHFAFTDKQLQAYGVKELHVLEQVLRTRDRKTMAAVAMRIRRKIDWVSGPDERDEDFLAAYYAALRSRLEQRMLFGHRRKDKHDKA